MPQTIYFDVLAQSPSASLVNSAGNQLSNSISLVNGDTKAFRFFAMESTSASTDYTPTTHNLTVTLGQPGNATTAVTYATATASPGGGTYWDITLAITAAGITTLLVDGKAHDATLEVKLVARSGGAEFTPVLKTVQIYPGLP